MHFDQVIVILLNQSINASKSGKSFQYRADLFVIMRELIETSESALALRRFVPSEITPNVSQSSKMISLRRFEAKELRTVAQNAEPHIPIKKGMRSSGSGGQFSRFTLLPIWK